MGGAITGPVKMIARAWRIIAAANAHAAAKMVDGLIPATTAVVTAAAAIAATAMVTATAMITLG